MTRPGQSTKPCDEECASQAEEVRVRDTPQRPIEPTSVVVYDRERGDDMLVHIDEAALWRRSGG